VIELRFHRELYDGFAIDEAVKVYADFVKAELEEHETGYLVRLTALPAATEQGLDDETIAAELGNFALGKTIERAGGLSVGGAP
jgi:hypothetical protein